MIVLRSLRPLILSEITSKAASTMVVTVEARPKEIMLPTNAVITRAGTRNKKRFTTAKLTLLSSRLITTVITKEASRPRTSSVVARHQAAATSEKLGICVSQSSNLNLKERKSLRKSMKIKAHQ